MTPLSSRVTVHMASSLDGYVARADGRVDWLETTDEFADGATLEPSAVAAFLQSIDCYVMGAKRGAARQWRSATSQSRHATDAGVRSDAPNTLWRS